MNEIQVIKRRGRPPRDNSQQVYVEESKDRRAVAMVRLHIAQQIGTSVSQSWDAKKHKVKMFEHPHGIEVIIPKEVHLDQEYFGEKRMVLTTSNIQSYVFEASV